MVRAGAVVVPYDIYVLSTSCGKHSSCLSYVYLGGFLAFSLVYERSEIICYV